MAMTTPDPLVAPNAAQTAAPAAAQAAAQAPTTAEPKLQPPSAPVPPVAPSPSLLLLAAEPAASRVAGALQVALDARVTICACRQTCLERLRDEEFSLVLTEGAVTAADPEAADALYAAAGGAPVLEINFGISSADRIVRQARATLLRRAQDERGARAAAALSFNNQLNASLTGLMLESEIALRQAGPRLQPTLRRVVEMANALREQLRP